MIYCLRNDRKGFPDMNISMCNQLIVLVLDASGVFVVALSSDKNIEKSSAEIEQGKNYLGF